MLSPGVSNLWGSIENNSDSREKKKRTKTSVSFYELFSHMVLLITVIMDFDLCLVTSPAGCLTSAHNVCTHLESGIQFL